MLVRRLLAMAGIAGLLIVAPAGAALAAPAPGPTPSTTTDCGLPPNDQPRNDQPPSDSSTATSEPATPGLDPGVICIASGVNTGGGTPQGSAGGGVAPAGPAARLPRTGAAPLRPTLAVGGWLLLVGVVAAAAGRRRTGRA